MALSWVIFVGFFHCPLESKEDSVDHKSPFLQDTPPTPQVPAVVTPFAKMQLAAAKRAEAAEKGSKPAICLTESKAFEWMILDDHEMR